MLTEIRSGVSCSTIREVSRLPALTGRSPSIREISSATRALQAVAINLLDEHRDAPQLLLVGHNPGIAEFAARLVAHPPANAEFQRYPTGATLVADFDIGDWSDVGFGSGVAVDFIVPREIAA